MRRNALVAAVLGLVLLLSACPRAATPTPGATPTPTLVAPTPMAPTQAVVAPTLPPPVAAPTPTGELRVALASFSEEVIDPVKGSFLNPFQYIPIYDTLVGITPEGTPAPGIAQRWEMAPDGLSWTFYLRKGVRFHNGDELTAEDVKFSIERMVSSKALTTFAATFRKAIEKVEVVDPYTVRIYTKGVQVNLAFMLGPFPGSEGIVMPKKYIEQRGEDYFTEHPIGSGPWKFVRRMVGSFIELEAVEDHWHQVPSFKRLTLLLVPEASTRLALLKVGQADVIEISAEEKGELERAGFRVGGIPETLQAAVNFYVTYAAPTSPMADVKVRRALSLAVNREELRQFFFMGEATLADLPINIFPYTADIDPAAWEPIPYDPQAALKLLGEAEYAKGFDLKLFTFTMPGRSFLPPLAEVIAGYWKKIGVNASIIPMDYGAFRPLFAATPHKEALMGQASTFGNTGKWIAPEALNVYWHSKGLLRLYVDPEIDSLIEKAGSETDPKRRKDLNSRAIKKVHDSYSAVPLVYTNALYAFGKRVGDWQPVAGQPLLGFVYETLTHAQK